jgi:hypothetical protein
MLKDVPLKFGPSTHIRFVSITRFQRIETTQRGVHMQHFGMRKTRKTNFQSLVYPRFGGSEMDLWEVVCPTDHESPN